MRQFDAFNPVTRRALQIHYVSPFICELGAESSGSGSGGGTSAVLEILPVTRREGPTTLTAGVAGNQVTLAWDSVSYAYSYNVYLSSVSSEGPFVLQTANLMTTSFVLNLPAGTYYAKVTLVEPQYGESYPSPTVQFVVL